MLSNLINDTKQEIADLTIAVETTGFHSSSVLLSIAKQKLQILEKAQAELNALHG